MSSACVELANNLPEQLRRLVMPDAPPHGLQAAIATELLGCLDTTSCLTLSATSRGLMADVGRSLTTLHLQRYDAVRRPSHNKVTARKARAALDRVLRLPTVASKRYLTNKVDRSVSGLIAHSNPIFIQTDDRARGKQGLRALDVLIRL